MRAAYEKKKKDLAKFRRGIENKEKHEAKIAKLKKEGEEAYEKKKVEEAERVERLKMERMGKDVTAATNNVDTMAAFESFGVMDVDSSGRISCRELEVSVGVSCVCMCVQLTGLHSTVSSPNNYVHFAC